MKTSDIKEQKVIKIGGCFYLCEANKPNAQDYYVFKNLHDKEWQVTRSLRGEYPKIVVMKVVASSDKLLEDVYNLDVSLIQFTHSISSLLAKHDIRDGQNYLGKRDVRLILEEYETYTRITENQSMLKMAKTHMDERAVMVLKERIKTLMPSEIDIDGKFISI